MKKKYYYFTLLLTLFSLLPEVKAQDCIGYIAKPATFTYATVFATVGDMSQILDGEGATGNIADGAGSNPHFYWMTGQNPVTFYIQMNTPSVVNMVKFYGPWGFDEGLKDVTVRLYSGGTLLGTENFVLPSLYSSYHFFDFSTTYTNVTNVQLVAENDYGISTVLRTSLKEVVFGESITNTPPPVKNLTYICPAVTVDLNNAHIGSIPSDKSLVWYTDDQKAGAPLAGAAITQAGAGTYYAFYYDSVKNCYSPASAPVVVRNLTILDSDGDGVPDACDLDSDNDGIKDIDENCTGYLAQNVNGPWMGKTTSNLTVSISSGAALKSGKTEDFNDGQFRYYANKNGAGLVIEATTNVTLTYTFSVPVPANEIAFYFNDFDYSVGTVNPVINFKINGGNPDGHFKSYAFGSINSYLDYEPITGLITSPNTTDDKKLLLRGISDHLVSSITVTSSGIALNDYSNWSLFALNACDTDGDGIPDYLDLDSDNDGCPDALEGDGVYIDSDLNPDGSINITTYPIDLDGVPNNGNSQRIGESQNDAIAACICPNASGIDSDGDGIDDFCDDDDDNDGPFGFIYITKKALDENSSTGFNFTINNNNSPITSFTLNDRETNIALWDLGSSQNGRLWVIGLNHNLYYRDQGSSTWVQTDVTTARKVDGGSGNSSYFINADGQVLSYDGVNSPVVIGSSSNYGNSKAVDVGSAWDNNPYIITANGRVYRYSGTGTTWAVVGNTTNNTTAIAGDFSTGNAVVTNGTTVYTLTSTGTKTSIGTLSNVNDLAVTSVGEIFASTETGTVVRKWINSTTWTNGETDSRYLAGRITGGAKEQIWGTNPSNPSLGNIYTRVVSGVNTYWLDDERVRTSFQGNSIMIKVPAGTYTVQETSVTGWSLQSMDIYDPTSDSSSDFANNSVILNVTAGETVHAVFTNGIVTPFVMGIDCGIVFHEDFGEGMEGSFGDPLIGQTSYHYMDNSNAAQDGYYKVVGRTTDFAWWSTPLTYDHTSGDGTGRMMTINASYDKGIFFRRKFTNLVVGKTYIFSAWLMSLSDDLIKPNVTFQAINPETGDVLNEISSGDITANHIWKEYSMNFVATSTELELVLLNNAPGGFGNDIALDDIRFEMGMPENLVADKDLTTCDLGSTTITITSPLGAVYEYSIDNINWQTSPIFNNASSTTSEFYVRYSDAINCVSSAKLEDCPFPNVCTTGDCNENAFLFTSDPNTLEYDNLISGFHSSIAKQRDGNYLIWGQGAKPNTFGEHLYEPTVISPENGFNYTGDILKATLGTAGSTNDGHDQYAVITTDGLYIWGGGNNTIASRLNQLVHGSVKNTITFDKMTDVNITNADPATGLPVGVAPTDVKMLFGSYATLGIVTCTGEAYVISHKGNKNGDGTSDVAAEFNKWHRVSVGPDQPLNRIVAMRGVPGAMVALTYEGDLYTWGSETYLGDGSAKADRLYATKMTLPIGVIPKMIGMTKAGNTVLPDRNNSYYLLSTTGEVYSLGDNSKKQLGTFDNIERTRWVNVKSTDASTNMTNIVWISPNEHDNAGHATVTALTADGKLWGWGANHGNMLGEGNDAAVDPRYMFGALDHDEKVLAIETGGHINTIFKDCDFKLGYIGHNSNGSYATYSSNFGTNSDVFKFDGAKLTNLCAIYTPPYPEVSNMRVCYGETADLTDAMLNSAPAGYTLEWWTTIDRTAGTEVVDPTTVTPGTYYAFFARDVDDCPQLEGEEVIVEQNATTVLQQDVPDVTISANNDYSYTVGTVSHPDPLPSGYSVQYTWEYATADNPTVWNVLDNTTFPGEITLTGSTFSISHATKDIDGIKVQVTAQTVYESPLSPEVIGPVDCTTQSNEFLITIKAGAVVTNPMLLNRAK